jgi:DNA mismatch repair ATPase MutS
MDILFAQGSEKETVELKKETVKDLGLSEVLQNITDGERELKIVSDIMTNIPSDVKDIRFRQEIMEDFLNDGNLVKDVTEALWQIRALKDYEGGRRKALSSDSSLFSLLEYLRELTIYISVLESLSACLEKNKTDSAGLKALQEQVRAIVNSKEFSESKEDILKMHEDLSNVRGVVVGINLTPDLDIEHVASVDFVPHRLKSKYQLTDILLSLNNIMYGANQGNSFGRAATAESKLASAHVKSVDPQLATLTPLIEKHLKWHIIKIRRTLSKYIRLDSRSITEMYEGLTFYIVMARLAAKLKEGGLTISMPKLSDNADRSFELKEFYNIRLFFAGEKNIVKNDLTFSPKENIYVLTGPNRGGKTILEQAVGINSVMAASGVFVTASSCSGRPFRNILTHFPIDENLTINYGRLGEEAVRIKEIVGQTDDHTLILFNETYSTTSAADGLYLSCDLIRILKEIGSSVIFNTHIHEVARSIAEMNSWPGESDIVSLVMEIKDNVTTFRVKRSAPESKSYARNIAEKYGITYEQMKKDIISPL